MLRKLGLLFAALALFTIAGGHWGVLQTVAWAGMLHDYTQRTGSVAMAVEQTFDGEHPCGLCLQIATAKQQESKAQDDQAKQNPPKSGIVKADKNEKAIPFQQGLSPVWTAATGLRWDVRPFLAGPSRDDQPPTPPPRLPSCV